MLLLNGHTGKHKDNNVLDHISGYASRQHIHHVGLSLCADQQDQHHKDETVQLICILGKRLIFFAFLISSTASHFHYAHLVCLLPSSHSEFFLSFLIFLDILFNSLTSIIDFDEILYWYDIYIVMETRFCLLFCGKTKMSVIL